MEPHHYHYRVSRLNDGRTTLTLGDIFSVSFRISCHSFVTGRQCLLYHRPSLSMPCHSLIQEGQNLLRTILSRLRFPIESLEEITEGIVSMVQELFQFDVVTSPPPPSSLESQHPEIPLWVEIIVCVIGVNAAIEESMHNFRMIPASDKAIQTSLKKSTVMKQSECCPVCLEDLDVNVECYAMPCHHVFHRQCIVAWLQTSHVCPLCRYPLPTIKN